jgi:iron-sulfur cluster repair protein YtfE (RIC family)
LIYINTFLAKKVYTTTINQTRKTMNISDYIKPEHRACDDIFATAEKAVMDGDFEKAQTEFTNFSDETLRHFHKEESVLFPTFEETTGMREGPTQMMRHEHEQMRGLISRMQGALDKQDKDEYLSIAESMMILLQQHNMKEEQMLYAMCDRAIAPDEKEATISQMEQLKDW